MSERLRDLLTVLALVTVLLGVLLGLWAWRRPGSAAPGGEQVAEGPPGPGRGSSQPGGQLVASGPGRVAATTLAKGAGLAGAVAEAAPAALSDPDPAGSWRARPAVDFSKADLVSCGSGVRVDLGGYEVRNGEEFTVRVSLSAPALESCALVMRYEPGVLALVPQSVRPDGLAFRGGVEAYEVLSDGKLVVIHVGTPGKKNVDAAAAPVLAWRMKACRQGSTHLELLPETSFTNGRGEDERYEVTGGDVSVR